ADGARPRTAGADPRDGRQVLPDVLHVRARRQRPQPRLVQLHLRLQEVALRAEHHRAGVDELLALHAGDHAHHRVVIGELLGHAPPPRGRWARRPAAARRTPGTPPFAPPAPPPPAIRPGPTPAPARTRPGPGGRGRRGPRPPARSPTAAARGSSPPGTGSSPPPPAGRTRSGSRAPRRGRSGRAGGASRGGWG